MKKRGERRAARRRPRACVRGGRRWCEHTGSPGGAEGGVWGVGGWGDARGGAGGAGAPARGRAPAGERGQEDDAPPAAPPSVEAAPPSLERRRWGIGGGRVGALFATHARRSLCCGAFSTVGWDGRHTRVVSHTPQPGGGAGGEGARARGRRSKKKAFDPRPPKPQTQRRSEKAVVVSDGDDGCFHPLIACSRSKNATHTRQRSDLARPKAARAPLARAATLHVGWGEVEALLLSLDLSVSPGRGGGGKGANVALR
jgi:hypothetical protein